MAFCFFFLSTQLVNNSNLKYRKIAGTSEALPLDPPGATECPVDPAVLNKLQAMKCSMQACNSIKKETLAQVFSCEFCDIFKYLFYRMPPDSCFCI